MGLPYGEEIMIVGRTMWTQSTSVTDRRTDGRSDGQTDRITITKTVQRRASHGKNLKLLQLQQAAAIKLKKRNLCYRKDDRAMRPVHGCPDIFRDSLSTPKATFPNIFHGLLFQSTL